MILSSKLPTVAEVEVTGASVTFNSVYPGIPLKKCIVDFDETTAISSITITANGTSQTISFGQSLTEGSLDVLTGILTKPDTTTVQLTPYPIDTVIDQNSISVDKGDLTVGYLSFS